MSDRRDRERGLSDQDADALRQWVSTRRESDVRLWPGYQPQPGRADGAEDAMPQGCADCEHAGGRFYGGNGATDCDLLARVVAPGPYRPTTRPEGCPLEARALARRWALGDLDADEQATLFAWVRTELARPAKANEISRKYLAEAHALTVEQARGHRLAAVLGLTDEQANALRLAVSS